MVAPAERLGGNNDTGGGADDQARHTLACFLKAAETLTLPPEAEDEAPSPRGQHSHHSGDGGLTPYGSAAKVRVRFHIIRTARIDNVGKSQSCTVSKLPIIWKQTVVGPIRGHNT